jgi:predicted nucleic acid-binding protein
MERHSQKVTVADASVIVKWFVDEDYTEHVLKMKKDYTTGTIDIWSTQLMPFEVLNALRYNQQLGVEELGKASSSLSKFKVALHPILDGLAELSIQDASRYGISIYDSSYLALSKTFDKQLYTADEKMLAKITGKEKVAHLKEYRL